MDAAKYNNYVQLPMIFACYGILIIVLRKKVCVNFSYY